MIIMLYPLRDLLARLRAIIKAMQIHTFILQTAPKALDKDIIHPTPLSIHGDVDFMLFKHIGEVG